MLENAARAIIRSPDLSLGSKLAVKIGMVLARLDRWVSLRVPVYKDVHTELLFLADPIRWALKKKKKGTPEAEAVELIPILRKLRTARRGLLGLP